MAPEITINLKQYSGHQNLDNQEIYYPYSQYFIDQIEN